MNINPTRHLVDSYGRRIRKLRVSLLDACNFRCFYCMPVDATFMSPKRWMSPVEIEKVAKTLVSYGLEEIRLTGGEPTLRKEYRKIVELLSDLPLKKFGITTNGYKLTNELPFLKSLGCTHVNVSLDSLSKEKFNKITRSDYFDQVIEGVLKAREMGFNVKVNTVLMRGINTNEIQKFIQFSADHDIEVRFLELMKIGQACGDQDSLFISAGEVIKSIQLQDQLISEPVPYDSTSFIFRTLKGSRVGFIASESKPFCGACSRWRLSADGFLRACLMSEKGLSVRGLEDHQLAGVFKEVLKMKPIDRIQKISQDMNQIGG